ncbi:MAG: hypothetical protein ACR2L4_02670 [Actinomycetota bacterium]
MGISPSAGSGLGEGSGESGGSGEADGLVVGDAEVGAGVGGAWVPHAPIASTTATAPIVLRTIAMVSVLRPSTVEPA